MGKEERKNSLKRIRRNNKNDEKRFKWIRRWKERFIKGGIEKKDR